MKILCATDLLTGSEAAIARAALLADQLQADVELLHVVVPDTERVLEQTLQIAVGHVESRAQPPLWRAARRPDVSVRPGNPARVILDALARTDFQLLILGPHRTRPLRDALEGTILEKALAAKRCPVLIVRDEARNPYRNVLLALDLSEASAGAVRAAESLVLTNEADAQVVHAYESRQQRRQHEAEMGMRELLKRGSADGARYDLLVEQGQPPRTVARAVEQHNPDLLVMGTRANGRLRRALLGSVANQVFHEVVCDTLIVPEGSFEALHRNSNFDVERGSTQPPHRAAVGAAAQVPEAARTNHPEYPLERLCTHSHEPFQLTFAQHAQPLFRERDDVELVASRQGLTIRAETEDAIDATLEVLTDFYGSRIRIGPPTIRYHHGASLEEPWMGLRIRCAPTHLQAVRGDLLARDAIVVSSEIHPAVAVIQARAPLARLLGYRSELGRLTSGAARHVMWLSDYAPVECTPTGGDAA